MLSHGGWSVEVRYDHSPSKFLVAVKGFQVPVMCHISRQGEDEEGKARQGPVGPLPVEHDATHTHIQEHLSQVVRTGHISEPVSMGHTVVSTATGSYLWLGSSPQVCQNVVTSVLMVACPQKQTHPKYMVPSKGT